MSRSRKVGVAVGLVILGTVTGVVVTLLGAQDLNWAVQWVTVVGFFVSTGLNAAGLLLGWSTWRQNTTAAEERPPTGQTVDNVAAGRVEQVSNVGGDLRFGAASASATEVAPDSLRPATPGVPSGDQSVTNARVEGVIRQVQGVDGHVEIDR